MDKKLAVISLSVFIALLVVYIGTFGWFMMFKERVCAVNLNSQACRESYVEFLQHQLRS